MKYNDNGTYKDIYVKALDTLPVGAEVDYNGQSVPTGWEEVNSPINAITINLSSNTTVSISSAYGTGVIPYDNIFSQVGNKLTFNSTDHTITIGAGVHHIEVNAHICIANGSNSSSDRYLSITNDTQNKVIGQIYFQNAFATNWNYNLVVTPTVVEVNENDVIKCVVASGLVETLGIKGSSSPRSILTIKVID